MNHRFHKVIFSQSQQQFVVVSELAKSSGKSPALPKAKVDDVFSLLFDNIFSNSELHLQSQTWQNNQLQAGKFVPRWRSSLTSVNAYLLQVVNYIEYFANFSDKSTACFGTSETLAPSGVATIIAMCLPMMS